MNETYVEAISSVVSSTTHDILLGNKTAPTPSVESHEAMVAENGAWVGAEDVVDTWVSVVSVTVAFGDVSR